MGQDLLTGVVDGGECSDNWDSGAEMSEFQSHGGVRNRVGNRSLRG